MSEVEVGCALLMEEGEESMGRIVLLLAGELDVSTGRRGME